VHIVKCRRREKRHLLKENLGGVGKKKEEAEETLLMDDGFLTAVLYT
jgi:hypothetical protein